MCGSIFTPSSVSYQEKKRGRKEKNEAGALGGAKTVKTMMMHILAAVVDEAVRCDTDGAAPLRLVLLDDKRKWTES